MNTKSGCLIIDLDAVRRNYRMICGRVDSRVTVAGVVKAESYGLQAAPIVDALLQEGCNLFFAANSDEAINIRARAPDADIVIFNGFCAQEAALYLKHNFIPVLTHLGAIAIYRHLARENGRNLSAYLHINTGMNRMGLGVSDVKTLGTDPTLLEGIDIRCVMSHLACADDNKHPMNAEQLQRFETLYARLGVDAPRSLANSAGVFLGADYHYDIVRPGMALYGLNPAPYQDKCPTDPVVSVSIPVIGQRILRAGETAGYGATYTAVRDMDVVTVGAGYADGIFRSLSNVGALYWKGIRCPIIGRVSMDMMCIDVSAVPELQQPKLGDYLEYIGDHQTAAMIGADAGSFDYEIITGLSARYARQYKNKDYNNAETII